jgi:hypothetical protein
MSHANTSLIDQLPMLSASTPGPVRSALWLRALALNCLTRAHSDLWRGAFQLDFRTDAWTKWDPRLPRNYFTELTGTWRRESALRTDFARRQALVEIDALSALALGLTLEELLTIYRVQFPVMRGYEGDTWYDKNGRVVFTSSKGLATVGLPRKASRGDAPCSILHVDGRTELTPVGWEDICDLQAGCTVTQTVEDDTLPGGPRQKQITYVAPFDRCDREEDYRTAWRVFKERFKH